MTQNPFIVITFFCFLLMDTTKQKRVASFGIWPFYVRSMVSEVGGCEPSTMWHKQRLMGSLIGALYTKNDIIWNNELDPFPPKPQWNLSFSPSGHALPQTHHHDWRPTGNNYKIHPYIYADSFKWRPLTGNLLSRPNPENFAGLSLCVHQQPLVKC